MVMDNEPFATLSRLEELLWRDETRFDVELMDVTFGDDMMEIGRSGRLYDRKQLLHTKRERIDAVLPLLDLSIRLLNAETALVTYISAATCDEVVEYARRSSIWTKAPTGWALRFHQGTPITLETAVASDTKPSKAPRW
jgi:hypothetical protein